MRATAAMIVVFTLCIAGTCIVPSAAVAPAKRGNTVVTVLANGELSQAVLESGVNSTTKDVSSASKPQLVQALSGATWSIKLPSCPTDLSACCSFFTNWKWDTWSVCFNQILNVGKALLEKVLEILDWITDAQKLSKLILSGPVGTKLWQLFDWGKKALGALLEAVENIVEGLVKVVMAMVRLVLALPKVPGCWRLNSNGRAWIGWSGAVTPTDCGAMTMLKKIQVWQFFSTTISCFARLTKVPHGGGISLPTPFLNRHRIDACIYHMLPILSQLADGLVQIVKAIIALFFDIVLLFLQLVGILAEDLIAGTPLQTLLHDATMLVTNVKNSLFGSPPASVESISPAGVVTRRRRRRRRRRRGSLASTNEQRGTGDAHLRDNKDELSEEHDEEDEKDEVVSEDSDKMSAQQPAAFLAVIERELESLEQESASSSSLSLAEAVMEDRELTRAALARLMSSHQQEHPHMWQNMHAVHNDLHSSEEEDVGSSVVDRWAMAVVSDMDLQSTVDGLVAMAVDESSASAKTAGFVMSIGAAVSCRLDVPWHITLPWKLPLITNQAIVSVSFIIQAGQTLESSTHKQHFSVGLKLAASMAIAIALDIGFPAIKTAVESAAAPLKMCDNEKLTSFSVSPGYTGAGCGTNGVMNTAGLSAGWGVSGWGFGFAMPLVIKVLAGILCGFVGGPVDKCMDTAPGDLIHFAAGWADFASTDAWYIKAGFNILFTKYDATEPFVMKRWTLLKISLSLSKTYSIFFGVPCVALSSSSSSSSSLATRVRSSVKARLASSCDAQVAVKACAGVDSKSSADNLARCMQHSLSSKLVCGAAADLEALHADVPVVDSTLALNWNGRSGGSSGFHVKVLAGWLSGLSGLEVVEKSNSNSNSLLAQGSGVRTTISLRSKSNAEDVQLRQVCLQWNSVSAANAFREFSGPQLSVQQRARQMASALERKMEADSSQENSKSHETLVVADWVAFVHHIDEQQQQQSKVITSHADGVHVTNVVHDASTGGIATASMADGDIRKCFKIRVGGVAATMEASVSGRIDGASALFEASGAHLHSFHMTSVAAHVKQQVMESASIAAGVESLLASLGGVPANTVGAAKQQLLAAVAKEISVGVEASLGSSLCHSLSAVVCPECQTEVLAAWRAQCGSVVPQ